MTSDDAGELIAGRYRLASELGRGAMGVVWLARDERLGRTVAVKELRAMVGLSSTQVDQSHQRARREARIAARLHHPNAVAVYDVAEHDDRPYLVMEYVEGRTLSEVLALGTVLEPARAAEIGVQLTSALAAAHDAGIVHRDIKPGNILITTDGKVKLTDFGISRAVGDVTVTGTGEMLGTPAYVAPEVAQGRAASSASDVFSLGATLYAAAEGVPPFEAGASVMSLLLRIVNGEMRPPRRSGPLTETLLWMMSGRPGDRPSMEQARRSLQGVATAHPVMPGPRARPDQQADSPSAPADAKPRSPDSPESATETRLSGAVLAEVRDEGDSVPVRPRRRRVPAWALLAVTGVLTAGIVAAVVAETAGSGTPAASPTTSSAAVAPSSSRSASPAASRNPSSPSSAASPTGDPATQLTSAIANYYRLVPDHLDQAWNLLTAGYQQSHPKTMADFRSFWNGMQSVSVSQLAAQTQSDKVIATIDYHQKDGHTVREQTWFTLAFTDGVWKIADSGVLSSRTL